MVPPFRGNAQGNAQGNHNLTRTQGGVSQKQQGGCPISPFHLSLCELLQPLVQLRFLEGLLILVRFPLRRERGQGVHQACL